MTGFGKANLELPSGEKLVVEVKSLNSKQLDLSTRLCQAARDYEPEIRRIITTKLERGKVELSITADNKLSTDVPKLNIAVIKDYSAQIRTISEELGIKEPENLWEVLVRLPDVTKPSDEKETDSENVKQRITTGVEEAVNALVSHRRAEGEKLESFFLARLDKISEFLQEVPKYEVERVTRIRERMEENQRKYCQGLDIDNSRMEQEMFFYIEKLDINEEKQRLGQHITYFRQTINDQDGGQGKKLGFIAQEMGREINTLGSKSNNAPMQQLVVKMKDVLEQIKEQVLNVM